MAKDEASMACLVACLLAQIWRVPFAGTLVIAPGLFAMGAVKGIAAVVMADIVAAIPVARTADPREVSALGGFIGSDDQRRIAGGMLQRSR